MGIAVSTALSSFPDNEQLVAASIAANKSSSEIYVPNRTKYAKIYGSYSGLTSTAPIEIISKSGVALPFLIKSNEELNENYFVPAKVFVGVSAEDGSPLTGNMVFENKTIPLNDWYSENFESFEYGVDFLPEFFDLRTF